MELEILISKEKQQFLWSHITENIPDIVVITETWMDTKIPLQNQYYKIYQTANKSSKGIAIIVKTDILSKEEK